MTNSYVDQRLRKLGTQNFDNPPGHAPYLSGGNENKNVAIRLGESLGNWADSVGTASRYIGDAAESSSDSAEAIGDVVRSFDESVDVLTNSLRKARPYLETGAVGLGGTLAASTALGANEDKGKKALSRFGGGAGATAGLLGGVRLGSYLSNRLSGRSSSTPSRGGESNYFATWPNVGLHVGTPLISAIVGGKLGSWLTSPGKRGTSVKPNTKS